MNYVIECILIKAWSNIRNYVRNNYVSHINLKIFVWIKLLSYLCCNYFLKIRSYKTSMETISLYPSDTEISKFISSQTRCSIIFIYFKQCRRSMLSVEERGEGGAICNFYPFISLFRTAATIRRLFVDTLFLPRNEAN